MALVVIWTAASWFAEPPHVAHMLGLGRKSNGPHLRLFEGIFFLMFAFLAKHLKVLESTTFCLGLGLSVAVFGRVARAAMLKTAEMRGLWAMNAVSRRLVPPRQRPCLLTSVTRVMEFVLRKEETATDVDIKAALIAQDVREQVMEECDDIRELLLEVEALGLEAHDETVFVRLPLMRDRSSEEPFPGEALPDCDQRNSVSSMTPGSPFRK